MTCKLALTKSKKHVFAAAGSTSLVCKLSDGEEAYEFIWPGDVQQRDVVANEFVKFAGVKTIGRRSEPKSRGWQMPGI